MALLDFFKKKKPEHNPTQSPRYIYAPTMSGGVPFYSSFGENLYASDIVVQSIRCKANEFKKLDPRHVRTVGGTQTVITDSSIAKVLRRPNEYMTMAEFLEKITILLELNKNVYIYPAYYTTKGGEKYYTGLYPLKPDNVTYLIDANGKYFIKLHFVNGYEAILPREDIIHWRKDYGVNDYFGGSALGGNDDKGLLRAVREYDKLCQSIAKAVECSCKINGIVQYNSYMSDEKQEAEHAAFQERLARNESGILFTDLKAQYTHLPRDVKIVDAETLKFYYDTILRASGTSLAILNGDYTKAQKEAYYEHALEADIKALGQAFSMSLFTDREASFGNDVIFYPNHIVFMSMENKIAVAQAFLPAGMLMKDEGRALFGWPPLPNGQGQVIAQGYNSLLDENNNNTLSNGKGGAKDGAE